MGKYFKLKSLHFDPSFSLINSFAFLIASSYVSGYLIHSTYLRTLGIFNSPLAKGEYLEIGFVFLVFSISIIFIPFIIWRLRQIRTLLNNQQGAKLKYKKIYKAVDFCSFFFILNFVYALIFFAIFTTGDDWSKKLNLKFFQLETSLFFIFFIAIFFGLVCLMSYFRKTKADRKEFAVRILTVLLVSCFDFFVFSQENSLWIIRIFVFVVYYLPILFFSVLVPYLCHRYYRDISSKYKDLKNVKEKQENDLKNKDLAKNYLKARRFYFLIGIIFTIIFFYINLLSYTFIIYTIIPTNKGGKLNISKAVIILKDVSIEEYNDLIDKNDEIKTKNSTKALNKNRIACKKKSKRDLKTFAVFILDQTDDLIYVAKDFSMFSLKTFLSTQLSLTQKIDKVYCVKKDNIKYIKIFSVDPHEPSTWIKS